MSRPPTSSEIYAVREAIARNQGSRAAAAFDRSSDETKQDRIAVAEQSAAIYLQSNGNSPDPIAKAVVDAARNAGHIDSQGNYIGEGSEAVAAKDPSTAVNACC